MMWTDLNHLQKAELIKEVWSPGVTSNKLVRNLAKKLKGTPPSRNSILGVYHRQKALQESHPLSGGLTSQQRSEIGKSNLAKRSRKRPFNATKLLWNPTVKTPPVRVSAESRAYDEASRHVPLTALGRQDCIWPVNNPPKGELHLFCGRLTNGENRYCAHHIDRSAGRIPKVY